MGELAKCQFPEGVEFELPDQSGVFAQTALLLQQDGWLRSRLTSPLAISVRERYFGQRRRLIAAHVEFKNYGGVQLVQQLGDVTFKVSQRDLDLLHDVLTVHSPAAAEQTLVLVKTIDFGCIGAELQFLPV